MQLWLLTLALPIEDLELPFVRQLLEAVRASTLWVNSLTRSGADLMDIRNFGAKSIDEVKAKLVELGLALKDSLQASIWPLVAPSTMATNTTKVCKTRV